MLHFSPIFGIFLITFHLILTLYRTLMLARIAPSHVLTPYLLSSNVSPYIYVNLIHGIVFALLITNSALL